MPPIGWHVATAREALARLKTRELEKQIGCYLLGSTAPDIRVITGRPREETHFIGIDADHGESGITHLLEAYPHLTKLQGSSRAFLAGYLTHLTVDELWIRHVYQPFFGRDSTLQSTLEANFMDRVLQFYMDRAERSDRDRFQQFYEYIFQADPGEELQFLDLPLLHRWREVVARILSQDPTWDAFRAFILRRFSGLEQGEETVLQGFCEAVPEVLERTLRYVTPERIAVFKEDAISHSVAAVRDYHS